MAKYQEPPAARCRPIGVAAPLRISPYLSRFSDQTGATALCVEGFNRGICHAFRLLLADRIVHVQCRSASAIIGSG
jgi:hypothetical protein